MSTDSTKADLPASVKRYAWYLMFMAGLGGLLYGIDVGVIAAALPYIEKTSTYTLGQLSSVVAAVLLGSVISSLFAGMLSEWLGRKKVIILSALLFTLSIPVICFSNNVYAMLMIGRLLQGASAGLVGVVVPMYLAECLDAQSRGKGTGMFQFLLTVGLVFAAVVGIVTTAWVGAATDVTVSLADKSLAWKTIFWCSALPGLILFLGAFKLKESPRWLYRRGREDEALISLAANNGEEAAKEILAEMKAADKAEAEQKEGLNITDEQIRADHEISDDYSQLTDEYIAEMDGSSMNFFNFIMEPCTATEANYYERNAVKLEGMNDAAVQQIADRMKRLSFEGETAMYLLIDGQQNSAAEWLSTSLVTAMSDANRAAKQNSGRKISQCLLGSREDSTSAWSNVYCIKLVFEEQAE